MSTNIQELALKVHYALLHNDHTATADDVAEIATLIREQATGVISDIDDLSVVSTQRKET